MTVLNRGVFAFALAAGSIALANCSGGGGGSSSGIPSGNPTAAPTTPATQVPTTASATAALPAAGTPYGVPAVGGFGGTITYSNYSASKSVVQVSYTTSLGAGAGAPAPQALKRSALMAPSVVGTEQISANAAVTFTAVPTFAMTLPTGYSNAGPFALEIFDEVTNQLIVSEAATSVNGNTVNFSGSRTGFAFAIGHVYAFELVLNGNTNPTASPSAPPTVAPTQTPQPTPTPTINPSPSASPTQSPSPVPTSTPACNAQGDPNMANVQLTGSRQTVDIPCFHSYRANITLPVNNGGGSSPLNLHLESSSDKPLGAPSPAPGTGTALFYESFKPGNRLVLGGTAITANISSQTYISPGHTYALNLFLGGTTLVPTITGIVPSGNNTSVTITLPAGTVFPAATPAQIVIYQSS